MLCYFMAHDALLDVIRNVTGEGFLSKYVSLSFPAPFVLQYNILDICDVRHLQCPQLTPSFAAMVASLMHHLPEHKIPENTDYIVFFSFVGKFT